MYRSLCDASVPYTYCSLPYAGKPDVIDGKADKYYVTVTDSYTKYLVNSFCKFNKIKGYNVSMDRYFTSVPLAKWASENNFTIVGIMRLDRIGLPNEIKPLRYENKNQPSINIKKMVMLFAIPMSIKKIIAVLSTTH